MNKIKLKNASLFGAFTQSFNNLSKIVTLPVGMKFQLVKLRKDMIYIAEIIKDSSTNRDEMAEIMKDTHEYNFDKIDPKLVADKLTAEDLFNLEPLLKE